MVIPTVEKVRTREDGSPNVKVRGGPLDTLFLGVGVTWAELFK